MTSSRKSNWDEVMEGVNKAIPAANHGSKTPSDTPIDPPVVKNANIQSIIYARIADNLIRVNNMLTGEKAEEYGNPRTMFKNISKRWFDCDNAEAEVAIMMAELKIERIKHDRAKEDSYLDAIAYLVMALAFTQEGKQNDQR